MQSEDSNHSYTKEDNDESLIPTKDDGPWHMIRRKKVL